MIPESSVVVMLVLETIAFVGTTFLALYFANKTVARGQQHVEEVLDKFLARKIEDIQMNKIISSVGLESPFDTIEDEGDPGSGLTDEETKSILADTEAEIAAAEEAGLRTV